MTDVSTDFSSTLTQFINTTNELTNSFNSLSSEQLNWKPTPQEWSIGQCVDHLINTNSHYSEAVEKVLQGEKRTFWEKLPLLPKIFGKLLLSFLDPKAQNKAKAPKVIEPSNQTIDKDVVKRFNQTQNKLADLMKKTANLPLNKVIITSPVTPVVTFALIDAYKIIATHDKRHFDQAMKVYKQETFPKS
jgi:hypothetical protein